MNGKNVNIQLTQEEAIVLFEFLSRFNEVDDSSRFEDLSEQRVLWDIECILERELSEHSQADYLEIVKKAREAVRNDKE